MVDDDEQLRPSVAEMTWMAQNKPSPPLWHTKETVPKAVEHVQIRQSSTPFRRPHWTARRCRVAGLGPVPVPGSAPPGGKGRWSFSLASLLGFAGHLGVHNSRALSPSPPPQPSLAVSLSWDAAPEMPV